MLGHIYSFLKTAAFCLQAIAFLQKKYWMDKSFLPILYFQVYSIHAVHYAAKLKVIVR